MPSPPTPRLNAGLAAGLELIYERMSRSRRRQLWFVFFLMLAAAIAELATIGAVVPLLTLIANPARGGRLAALVARIAPAGTDPLLWAAVTFILVAVVACAVRIQLAWSSRSFVLGLGHELAVEIQRRVLLQPFSFHLERNSSRLVAAVNKTELLVMDALLPLMHAVTGAVIAVSLVGVLLWIDAVATAVAVTAFLGVYILISAATQRRLAANSASVDAAYDQRLQTVQESLGGIREVIVDDSNSVYLRQFAAIDSRLATARLTNQFITAAPRYMLEAAGMIAIAAIALVAAHRGGGIAAALPLLGALALGGQRLLPLVQQIYAGWSSVAGQRAIFGEIIGFLRLPVGETAESKPSPIELRHGIKLEDVRFRYPGRSNPALDGISIDVPCGTMLAVVGPTGSGKSTLLDVLMGLLQPDHGQIFIDGTALDADIQQSWFRSIAHVPQSIFLTDSTISANIALSLPGIPPNLERTVDAAKKAQLHHFVVSLPEGYDTIVGERGIRLSGGQRQRLAIARAIYKDAPVFILDEPTSALDVATESSVISALDELRSHGRTIIVVAHRLSTIRRCDMVVRLQKGMVVDFGPFEEVLGRKSPAREDEDSSIETQTWPRP